MAGMPAVTAPSLTSRISLLLALAVSVVLLATGYFLSKAVQAHFVESDRHMLTGKLELIRNLFARATDDPDFAILRRQLDDALVGHHDLTVVVADDRGGIWFTSASIGFPRALLDQAACPASDPEVTCLDDGLRQWARDGKHYRGLVAPLRAGNGAVHHVLAALDIEHHRLFMTRFHRSLALAMTLAALVTAALGWAATRHGLAPLRRIAGLASGMSADRLDHRLPEAGLPEELRRLADAFNAMLARLEESFQRLNQFSSDIAHELRTPVSNLMTQTQVALAGVRSPEAYREILYSSLEEYERMAQMIGDMLYLAQADQRLLKPGRQRVDLAAETRNLFEFFEAWAEERRVGLESTGAAVVAGDRLMLRRALSNLIANAVRHTAGGNAVRVVVSEQGGRATLSVENPGTDIPEEHLRRLFDRFYRVDPARQRGDGVGLGLAIVKSIVELHGGAIGITSDDGVTRFVITLPVAKE
jgi:two-component system, OmpR family, heavy metal sensor histidine kinase CusS